FSQGGSDKDENGTKKGRKPRRQWDFTIGVKLEADICYNQR
ncbi:unnamed protein product, partial [marine sediment metagenome]